MDQPASFAGFPCFCLLLSDGEELGVGEGLFGFEVFASDDVSGGAEWVAHADSVGGMEGKGGFSHENPGVTSVEWYTPQWLFDALDVRFDLDPCAAKNRDGCVPADRFYRLPEHDGLSEPWFGRVWLNPPYGKQTGSWIERLAQHGNGIALVFSRTSTRWFQQIAARTSAVCFISKRVRFVNGTTGLAAGHPGADSVLIAFGEDNATVLRRSGLGAVFTYASPA